MSLKPWKWRELKPTHPRRTFMSPNTETGQTQIGLALESKVEQDSIHRLWPFRDRSEIENYEQALVQRYRFLGGLACSAAVASIHHALRHPHNFHGWIQLHAGRTPPGYMGSFWMGRAADGVEYFRCSTRCRLTCSLLSPGELADDGRHSAGGGVGAARVPKTPGKAKRRRLRKRQEREQKERQAQQLKAAVERSPLESYFGECC
ncbi:hypothetical protein B0H14DRAFT_2645169 [Mycena olivaceomarginata]|nr:hypothetical protein B0H14DRAFT_2645169 [Mycena olivaceomarginata]